MASYRYARGVCVESAFKGLCILASMIHNICGGDVNLKIFEYKGDTVGGHIITLPVKKTNCLLGTDFTADEIEKYLERCFFDVSVKNADELSIGVPDFRLDVDDTVDLIEEVGRMYGYHNIVPKPVELNTHVEPNSLNITMNRIRNLMVGFNGIECLTYSFIPDNLMEFLGIQKESYRFYGDVIIQNPLSNAYALMRPTMAYNMLQTAVENVKFGCRSINIFELGRTFFRQAGYEFGYNQRNTIAGMLYGVNYNRSVQSDRDIEKK